MNFITIIYIEVSNTCSLRMASIEAARQNIHPIPENAEDPIIQDLLVSET